MARISRFALLPWLALSTAIAQADFSHTDLEAHPTYPGSAPFFLDIEGTWPSDCHPGEQLPRVRSYDGQVLEIEYEIVVVHVTCNPVDTAFRSLVAVPAPAPNGPAAQEIQVIVRFGEASMERTLQLSCSEGPCPGATALRPEAGQYTSPGRRAEGLVVDLQQDTLVVYALSYDEAGGSEWLFSAGPLVGDAYFADLYLFTGGDCLACDSTHAAPAMTRVGRIGLLVDRPAGLKVQINDRPVMDYRKLVYGHAQYPLEPNKPPLTDLAGRWALSENQGTDPPLGDLSEFLPPAFDLSLEYVAYEESVMGGFADVAYRVTDITGRELGQLFCPMLDRSADPVTGCDFIDATDQAEPLLRFYQAGTDTLDIEYGRAVIAVGVPPSGTAARIR